jgi:2-hydroxy-3-keto-5-methylthiopentenyl-1-phosphate phosphatase
MSSRAIIAIMYDFDRTLSTEDMQNYRFIPSLGIDASEFWALANGFANENRMDGILAYMYTMIDQAKKRGIHINRNTLVEMGKEIELFPGVYEWFKRINDYGHSQGVEIEHYVISSGLREIIQGSPICHEFKEIFASEFYYDNSGAPAWPKAAVNYTNKTQFIYRINKGILDISNDKDLNRSMPENSKRVRFSNMIYIGDGLSDVPCMKMVKAYGGTSIAVFEHEDRAKVEELLARDRVDYIYPADYRENSGIDVTVKNIIRKMSISDVLSAETAQQRTLINNL